MSVSLFNDPTFSYLTQPSLVQVPYPWSKELYRRYLGFSCSILDMLSKISIFLTTYISEWTISYKGG